MGLTPPHERGVEAPDDLIDASGQLRPVVASSMAFAQFVRAAVMVECLVVMPDVVEIFAERMAEADFVSQCRTLGEKRFGSLELRGVIARHFAMRRHGRERKDKIRVDCDRPLKQFPCFRKLTQVGA